MPNQGLGLIFELSKEDADAADVLVDAMVAGVYAGDARQLSLSATFPKMLEMERDHGGLFRAMIARRRGRSSGGGPALMI